jgi:predicted outer membrane repeat protein
MSSKTRGPALAIVAVVGLIVAGCGDDGSSPKPASSVEVQPHTLNLEIGGAAVVTATVTGGGNRSVDWYVNGILGGHASCGCITQANPATYSAPDALPAEPGVVIKAVSCQNPSKADSCMVTLMFSTVYVDGMSGDDETGTGIIDNPVNSIARGIDIADSGMKVHVACGTYYENDIDMKAGVLLVGETGDPDCVTIDAMEQGRIFKCVDMDTTTAIRGFTITGAHPTGQVPHSTGGGAFCDNASPIFTECVFLDNTATYGGGVHCVNGAAPIFRGCTFAENSAEYDGGGLAYSTYASAEIVNCTFFGNYAGDGGGALYVGFACDIAIENSIIAFGRGGGTVRCYIHDSTVNLTCCDLFGNDGGDWEGCISDQIDVEGNFSEDPAFCDTLTGDLRLGDCSPCLPGNHPAGADCGMIGAWPQGCTCQ